MKTTKRRQEKPMQLTRNQKTPRVELPPITWKLIHDILDEWMSYNEEENPNDYPLAIQEIKRHMSKIKRAAKAAPEQNLI